MNEGELNLNLISEVEDLVDEGGQSDEGCNQMPSGVPSLEDLVEESG